MQCVVLQQDEAAQALSVHFQTQKPPFSSAPAASLICIPYDTAYTHIYHSRNKILTSILHRHSSNFATTSENSGLPCEYNRKSRAVLKIEGTSSMIKKTNRYMMNHKSPPFPFL